MVISFSSERALRQLLEEGRVFTVRVHRRKQFIDQPWGRGLRDWANEGRTKPKTCDVIIFEVGQFEARELHNWQPWSGFENMGEWIEEIKRLNRWKFVGAYEKFWLYMVCETEQLFRPSIEGRSIELVWEHKFKEYTHIEKYKIGDEMQGLNYPDEWTLKTFSLYTSKPKEEEDE